MRKVILAVIVALLAGCCGTCFGRKLADPDTLTFRKTYSMPGMSEDELYIFSRGWPDKSGELRIKLVGTPLGVFRKFRKKLRWIFLWSKTIQHHSRHPRLY